MNNAIWKNKKVLLTGHTGFKGAWLSLWLSRLGAQVHGIALDPPSEPNLFNLARVGEVLASDTRLDIGQRAALSKRVSDIQPEVVFHLAAQSLVHNSYDFPIETYSVNVMGTAHVLDALRSCPAVRAAVVVTTDKCYENQERVAPYAETDRLGGFDPYSSSKACAELVASAYRRSYFASGDPLRLATARAGNVIGGGDWAADRLIPDCIRAYASHSTMNLRCPQAVRPWQHVLESLKGYLMLAERLLGPDGAQFAEAWNFGPELADMDSVGEVAGRVCDFLGVPLQMPSAVPVRHEASLLRLDSSKAKQRLNWHPRWNLHQAVDETLAWYRHWFEGREMQAVSCSQIDLYEQSDLLAKQSA
jgi:CDP-glucose 4,6-dehydratase